MHRKSAGSHVAGCIGFAEGMNIVGNIYLKGGVRVTTPPSSGVVQQRYVGVAGCKLTGHQVQVTPNPHSLTQPAAGGSWTATLSRSLVAAGDQNGAAGCSPASAFNPVTCPLHLLFHLRAGRCEARCGPLCSARQLEPGERQGATATVLVNISSCRCRRAHCVLAMSTCELLPHVTQSDSKQRWHCAGAASAHPAAAGSALAASLHKDSTPSCTPI